MANDGAARDEGGAHDYVEDLAGLFEPRNSH
jgi:hypothetical protein